ncbi:pyridoxal phosphate-dependent aminotransferase [Pararhodobacter sp. CCB-MM2]|uniref:pyridoxal phosphate-dependent aminotransferase n=1 Tax=Pararhodobacter sp. CCB-MM2 TaxID=1786003 RepID=UPI00082F6D76|nr:pyridoxal phosphate-dependent aminotransferase [Pararhodobacter sp. CCB-MM2]
MSVEDKFKRLATDHAPGQETRQARSGGDCKIGDDLPGTPVDFSHGDVDAHEPTPGSREAYLDGVARGGSQAYTEYRGGAALRAQVAERLAAFTGAPVDGTDGLIVTPGTQGALFLALGALVAAGDRVAIVQPDYFANRKIVEFLEGRMIPVQLRYRETETGAGLDLAELEAAFRDGARVFLFSNPNNPCGLVYSADEIAQIAALADRYGATVVVDQLYSRLLYTGSTYTHLRASGLMSPDNVITIMGPSKTESLSGYRLGVAFGAPAVIARMEKLQAIVSLRAAGYSQAVLATWFAEPEGWMDARIAAHQAIRDDLVARFRRIQGCTLRVPEAGSYLFPQLPELTLSPLDFIRALREQAGVTVTPGTEFSPHEDRGIRLNFSQDHAAAVAAVERIAAMVDRYRA